MSLAKVSSTKQIITKIVEDVVENKLQPIDKRLSSVEKKLNSVEKKQDKMFDILADMAGDLKAIREENEIIVDKVYTDHEDRLTKVETNIGLA